MTTYVSPGAERAYQMFSAAADRGERAPSNPKIAAAVGVKSSDSVRKWLTQLENAGRVRVTHRNTNWRIIEIVETGKRTAEVPIPKEPEPLPPLPAVPTAPFTLASAVMFLRADGFLVERHPHRKGMWRIGGTDGYDAKDIIAFADRMRGCLRRAA